MTVILVLCAGILGALIGSFVNVLVMRIRTGKSLGGRSTCMSCKRQLKWYELIPIMSYLIVRARCLTCYTPLSRHYLIGEVSMAVLFAGIALYGITSFGDNLPMLIANMLPWMIVGILGIGLSLYDIRHMIVPNTFVYPLIAVGIIALFFSSGGIWTTFTFPEPLHIIAGPLIALPFFLIWFFSKGRLFGFGDVKIILAIGWLLGLVSGIFAVVISFWIAAVCVALSWMVHIMRGNTMGGNYMKLAIPFGPFLIVSLYVMLFFGQQIHTFFISW